jgi:hypothetical protein
MEVSYGNIKIISQKLPYQEINLPQTINQPTVTISPNSTQLSSLIMYDPDSVKGIFIHWLVINIPKNSTNINDGTFIKKYYKPSPPPKTGKHRYIFELYYHANPLIIVPNENIDYDSASKILSKNPNATFVKRLVFLSENENNTQSGGRKYKNKRISVRRRSVRRRSVRRKIYNKKTKRVYKNRK